MGKMIWRFWFLWIQLMILHLFKSLDILFWWVMQMSHRYLIEKQTSSISPLGNQVLLTIRVCLTAFFYLIHCRFCLLSFMIQVARLAFLVTFSMEVNDGLLVTSIPAELINSTELKLKTSFQWEPLQTYVTISKHFTIKASVVRFYQVSFFALKFIV